MKKVLLISILLIVFSCRKNKPQPGLYLATFNGTYLNSNNQETEFNRAIETYIVDVNKTEIKFAYTTQSNVSSTLTKDKKSVYGVFNFFYANPPLGENIKPSKEIQVKGSWSKTGHKKYSITGSYTHDLEIVDVNNQTVESYIVNGKFEIKSK